MSEILRSVGLDVGTTSTQMIVSELKVENRASAYSVPDLEITERRVLYKSPVYFTPLLDASRMDGEKLRELVEKEYRAARIRPDMVDTGAIIVTGESSRTENAARVLEALSDMAGEFVVAAAGPDLESILAAKGSGAVDYSRDTGKTVLHMDIGGGTTNLALIRQGEIIQTGCMNVGGRLIKYDENQVVTYVSPVLGTLGSVRVGQRLEQVQAQTLAKDLAQALEMAAGLRPWDSVAGQLLTSEASGRISPPAEPLVLSFSGGVADCMENRVPWNRFSDLGPLLGKAIRESRLCQGPYILGKETIRATVIGAGCHASQLSGSTVFIQNMVFPVKNAPVVDIRFPEEAAGALRSREGPVVLALQTLPRMTYRQLRGLAEKIAPHLQEPVLICMEQDMAKAFGQALALRLPRGMPMICMDRIRAGEGTYLDIGEPVGGAIPVVVKTLVLGNQDRRCV